MSDPATTHELRLHQHRLEAGAGPLVLEPATRVLYVVDGSVSLGPGAGWPDQLAANEAAYGTGEVAIAPADGPATLLRWELVRAGAPTGDRPVLAAPIELDTDTAHLLRCDRVDFPPGGVALLHTHQGPGIRCLLHGHIQVQVNGERRDYGPMGSWFERGPDPVFAATSETEPSAFARVMVLPRSLLGRPSISYVRDEDRDAPKSQRYTVLVDEPIDVADGGGP